MAIFGLGTDIVEIARIESQNDQFIQQLKKRILTESEKTELQQTKFPARFLAKRWAAKEACAKAFGTGIGKIVGFQDMEIGHNNFGKPFINFTDKASDYLQQHGVSKSHISISDEQRYAVATVILES